MRGPDAVFPRLDEEHAPERHSRQGKSARIDRQLMLDPRRAQLRILRKESDDELTLAAAPGAVDLRQRAPGHACRRRRRRRRRERGKRQEFPLARAWRSTLNELPEDDRV